MKLMLNEDQLSIKESAKRFFSEVAPVSVLRRLRDQHDTQGYDQDVWRQMVNLGFSAITIPEAEGGLGLGYATLGVVFEESGRTLCASPLFASLVLGASVIELCETDGRRGEWLELVASGQLTLALAHEEGRHHSPRMVTCSAKRIVDGYVLNGCKSLVLDGAAADKIIVLARTSGAENDREGLSFFMVDRTTDGLVRTRLDLIDSRGSAKLVFNEVIVNADALLGSEGQAYDVLERVMDRARVLLAAEMLGGTTELFERTLSYLREREQFGVKIGSFQALRHRAAKLYTEIELTRSVVMAALSALDESSDDMATLASLAKCRANDVYRLVSNEAIQMHGGIGVTDELDIGLFLKRARVAIQCFGDSNFHRDRFALHQGY